MNDVRTVAVSLVLSMAPLFGVQAEDGSRVKMPTPNTFKIRSELAGQHPRLHFSSDDIPRLRQKAHGEAKWFYEKAADQFASRLAARSAPGDVNRGDHLRYMYGFWGLFTVDLMYAIDGSKREFESGRKMGNWLVTVDDLGNDDLILSDMLTGLALSYDILYPDLTEAERARWRKKIYRSIDRLYKRFFVGQYWTMDFQNNHMHNRINALAHGAFAIYGDDPALDVQKHADLAVSVIRKIAEWAPEDGSNHEGPGYWSYGHHWAVRAVALLEHVTGENLAETNPHFALSHYYRLYMTAPGWKHSFNIGDGGGGGPGNLTACAKTVAEGRDELGMGALQVLMQRVPGGFYQHAAWGTLWYDASIPAKPLTELPLWRFWPDLEMFSIRSSWADEASAFVFKCGPPGGHRLQTLRGSGYANVAHDHPDQNHFMLFAHGKMLAQDDGYPKKKKLTRSHNTMVIDGKGQPEEGSGWLQPADYKKSGFLEDVFLSGSSAIASGNASLQYAGASHYVRHVAFVEGDYLLTVDDLVGAGGGDHTFEWRLHKDGKWSKVDDTQFSVADGDVSLDIAFLQPTPALTSSFLPAELTAEPCLASSFKGRGGQIVAMMMPRRGATAPFKPTPINGSNCTAIEVASGGRTDTIAIARQPGGFSAGDLRGAGAAGLVRASGSRIELAMVVRGSQIRYGNTVLLGASAPVNMSRRLTSRGTIVEVEAAYKTTVRSCSLTIGALSPGATVGTVVGGGEPVSTKADGNGVARLTVDLRERITLGSGSMGTAVRAESSGGSSSSAHAHEKMEPPEELVFALRVGIMGGFEARGEQTVYIDFGGSSARAKLKGVDEEGILVEMRGMNSRIEWDKISPRRLYGIATKYVDDEEVLEAFRMTAGLDNDGN